MFPLPPKPTSTSGQILRYAAVGVIAMLVDVGVLFIMTHFFGLHYLVSAALGFFFGVIINYLLSIRFVFESTENLARETTLFVMVGALGLLWNQLILWLLVDFFHAHYLAAKGAAIVLIFFWNFFMRKKFVFRQ